MNPLLVSKLAQNKTLPIVLGVLVVGVVGFSLWKGKRIMCSLGLATCDSNYRKRLSDLKFLYPNYYDATKISITHQQAKVISDEIESSLNGADDEEEVYASLQKAKTRNNISLVSKYFSQRHSESMIDRIAYDMGSKDEMVRVMKILKALN